MSRIKKTSLLDSGGRIFKATEPPEKLLCFSFRHFTVNTKFALPEHNFARPYLATLLTRLKDLSGLTVREFRENKSKTLRIHKHDWAKTSEAEGYAHLNEQLQQCEPWQFCLSANEHGRVHGILIDDVFYVVWLDIEHALYP